MQTKERRRRAFFNWRYVHRERRRGYRLWAALLVALIPGFFLCRATLLSTGRITDISMLPTLSEGQFFLIQKWVYRFGQPQRGDVVVFLPPDEERWRYVKRVIAAGGDEIAVREGRVWRNGEPLEEPYALGGTYPDMEPMTLAPGSCFVLGDNRPESEDSRRFGPVPVGRIEGRIRARSVR